MKTTAETYRVLLVEDNATDAKRLKDLMSWKGGRVTHPFHLTRWVRNLGEALEIIEAGQVDLIIVDLTLPDCAGVDVILRINKVASHLPVIVLSDLDDEMTASSVVQKGAQDYVIKSELTSPSLQRVMRHAVEREKIEQALGRKTEFLQAMLISSPDRIYFKDANSRFLQVNQALAAFFGLKDPDDVIGKSDFDFFAPERARQKAEDERRVMETGRPIIDKIEREELPDGFHLWLLTTKMPLRDRHGKIVGTFGASRDITLIKEMEETIERERNLLRSVIDNVPDYIHAKDTLGRYILNNMAHVHHLNESSPSALLGKTVFDYFPNALAEQYFADDMLVLASGEPIIGKVEPTVDADGSKRWISTTKVPIYGQQREMMGVATIARDVTEAQIAREQLEQVNADLFRSREELLQAMEQLRTVQLELIEAEKMKLVGRLAAGVAHEVKNPLAIIRMGADYMARQQFDDKNMPIIIQEIRDAVERADNVVRGLLDFSAPKRLQLEPSDLNALVRHALLLIRGELAGNKFIVTECLDPNLPLVRMDAMKFEQVLVNVFTNAVHAMEGGGELTIRTSAHQITGVGENIGELGTFRPGDRVAVVEVLDTGHGVPEAELGKVFEPFFTKKPTGKGTGLGLTVTKSIIDLHAGAIDIRNRPEGGACVTIQLRVDDPL